MREIKYNIIIILILLLVAFGMFYIHFMVFGQLQNTLYYSLMNLSFIPINIIFVTLVFEKLIEKRKKRERTSKLNMLAGVYFSEVGFLLLDIFVSVDEDARGMVLDFSDLKEIKNNIKKHHHKIDFDKIDYKLIKKILLKNQTMLINLISNENILEHELLGDLLMATLHLRDEIVFRGSNYLSEDDRKHLENDSIRVYKALTLLWINYLIHLKVNYPYIYKADVDANPFDSDKEGIALENEISS